MTAAGKIEFVTFRLHSEIADLLRKEAKSSGVSISALANSILHSYFDFDLIAKNAGFIPLPKKTVRGMVNALREEEIVVLGNGVMSPELGNLAYATRGRFDLHHFLDIFQEWASRSSFQYHDEVEGGYRNLIIKHDRGKKWSLLLRGSLEPLLRNVTSSTTFEQRENMLLVDIKE